MIVLAVSRSVRPDYISFNLTRAIHTARLSFASYQRRNLIKTFQMEGINALITKMTLIFSSDLLNGQK